ncbi:thioredoxin-like 3-2, chloroplastic isoform X1 [Apium graveolens]|uniref:thioredoxin-like 3-2, chloroplastic isoform X1 n=1 Tax=Apium graveolens TaxID=4045 RepID=UPI003D7BD4BA
MSGTMHISPLTKPSLDSSRLQLFQSRLKLSTSPSILKLGFEYSSNFCVIKGGNVKALTNCTQGSVQNGLESSSVKLELISSETQFDRVIADAQQLDEALVILWMASWCRKCIYLKPKLEKLAADYFPRLIYYLSYMYWNRVRFYCVDVNNVPHRLVVRAGVTKMPTVQLWKDSQKQGEVIGGHKAYLVVNEVRQMIECEDTL